MYIIRYTHASGKNIEKEVNETKSCSMIMQIPADMVINCVITTIVTHSSQSNLKNFIYHVASLSRNPLKISNVHNISNRYFTKSPCTNIFTLEDPNPTDKNEKPIIISKAKLLLNPKIWRVANFLLPLFICCLYL